MTAPNRPLRLRLFTEPDVGAKHHGWRQHGMRTPEGARIDGAINDMGFGLMHVVNQKAADGVWKDQYDQYVLFENPGAIVVCTDAAGRVGLVPNFRLVGDRPEDTMLHLRNSKTGAYDYAAYVKTLREKGLFQSVLDTLGQHVWELPRGLAPAGETADLAAFIKKVAAIEAKEEAGLELADIRLRGKVNANTTFFPHAQFVVSATIVGAGASKPEERESIGKLRMFAPEELRRMSDQDELFDGLTLACLAKAGYRF
jgi:8-oxo-dGTP pyrophosphatase MutT (NUDIX family)